MSGRINLSQLYSHIGGDLHDDISELMARCACPFFRSIAWSSRCSLDLTRFVSRRVTGIRLCPRRRSASGRGGCSGARILVRRWWIPLFPDFVNEVWWILVQGSTGPYPARRATTTHGSLVAAACSTHKTSLAMVLLRIWQWWWFGVSSNVCLGGVGVSRWPVVLASARKPMNSSVFFLSFRIISAEFLGSLFSPSMFFSFYVCWFL
jgi:hypothetical protein